MQNDERRKCYSSRNIRGGDQLKGLRSARHVARMGEMRNSDKILIAKSDEKRPFRETQAYVRE